MRLTPSLIANLTCCMLISVLSQSVAQVPHGTEFTYQGQLKQSSTPVTESADFVFNLMDAEFGGNSVGAPLVATNVSVVEGLFTVELDFGGDDIKDKRWLEIAVRVPHDPTDGAPYSLLAPRQAINGAPFSLHTRGLDVSDNGDISVGGAANLSSLTVYRDPAQSGSAIKGWRDNVDPTIFGEPAGVEGFIAVDAPTDGGNAVRYAGVKGSSSGGAKHIGVYGVAFPTIQFGVDHRAGVFGTTAAGYGILGHNAADGLAAVMGQSFQSSGTGIGVHGTSRSTESIGVLAEATHFNGINYALLADTSSTNGYAGYFVGGRNYFEGNVGIGTTEPAHALDVVGSIDAGGLIVRNPNNSSASYVLGWLNDVGRIRIGGTGAGATNGFDFQGIGNASLLRITGGGLIGINTTSPGFDLEVNGSAGKPGGGSWSNSSDRRLKKNIQDLDGSLDQLMKLRGVTFEYKDPEAIHELHGTRIGMIAQEVEEVFPDWVSEGGHGYKTLTFRGFESLTVEALRELRAEKDRQLREKDAEIADLTDRLERMEAMMARVFEMNPGEQQ